MSISPKLLEILVCPITKQSVSVMSTPRLEKLNHLIETGEISNQQGDTLAAPLQMALITENGQVIYPVVDSIPVMLEGESIATVQIKDWI